MVKELTIDQARANAANFMYIFAPDEFLAAIPKKYANIIRGKAGNQNLLLDRSARKYKSTLEQYQNAVRDGFIEQYGMTPIDALITLAKGGRVAGKDWSKGIFGVGALSSATFTGAEVNGQTPRVDQTNGHIYLGSKDITDTSKTIVEEVNGKTVNYQLFSQDDVFVFTSQYQNGKYYAASYVDPEGQKHSYDGKNISNSDSATIWSNIILSVQTFIDWLLSLFGYNSSETINTDNTLPNQKTDGFVYESGLGEMGLILLATAAGGLILATSGKGKKKSK